MTRYGGIEAGGTKWVCALSTGDGSVIESTVIPTTTPEETLAAAIRFLLAHGPLAAVGVGGFGPVDLRAGSPTFGQIRMTPKPGWANTDLLGPLRAALRVPVAIDTDVNAAAVGELHWGAGRHVGTFAYLTVGTGIGGGIMIDSEIVHGYSHPELGHMRIPHDTESDPFPGTCPYHGDCLEGLASGEALRKRWGQPAEELEDDQVWQLEAHYLALAVVNLFLTVSPERIIVGGGVCRRPDLLARVRQRIPTLVAGYVDMPGGPPGLDDYVVAPELGRHSGVLGAVELARQELDSAGHQSDPFSATTSRGGGG